MKILLKILLGLAILLMAALGAASLLLNTNAAKEEITERISATTGLSITLNGDLGLSVFPAVELEINDASLANAPDFGQEPFAHLRQTRIRAKWSPLLEGRLEIDRVMADGLTLNLIRDKRGAGNWEQLRRSAASRSDNPAIATAATEIPPMTAPTAGLGALPSNRAETAARPPIASALRIVGAYGASPAIAGTPRLVPVAYATNGSGGPHHPLLNRLSINALHLTDSTVKWTDHLTGARVVVSEIGATSGRIAPETPIALTLIGKAVDAGSGLQTRFALDTVLTADRDVRRLTLSPTELRLSELTTQQGLVAETVLTTAIDADLGANRYLANSMIVRFTAGGTALRGTKLNGNLRANLTLDAAAQTLELVGLSISSGALRIDGSLTAQQLFNAPALNGQATIPAFDLRNWLGQQGLPAVQAMDPTALTKVGLRTDWRSAAGQLDLENLEIALDQTLIAGWATILPTNPVGYRFDLTADVLDLDRYLPPNFRWAPTVSRQQIPSPGSSGRHLRRPQAVAQSRPAKLTPARYDPAAPPMLIAAAATRPAAPVATAPRTTQPLFPIELVRRLDLDGRLRIGELRLARLAFGDADLQISADGGQLRIDNSVERFYAGHISGHLGLSAQENPPTLSLEQWADGIQTGVLLKDLTGDDVLTGHGKLSARLSATGLDPVSNRQSLGGEVRLEFSEGVIKGLDLHQMIREAEARLTGKPMPPWRPAQTEYTALSATATIHNGVLHNKDLMGTSEYLHVSGHGSIDLANERLDYRLAPKLVDPPEGRGIKEIEDIPIPVHITGSFQRPKWDIELGPVLREAARRGLGEDIEEKAGKLIKKLEESTGIKGLEKGLRNLFGF